jgi:hypothetical protein
MPGGITKKTLERPKGKARFSLFHQLGDGVRVLQLVREGQGNLQQYIGHRYARAQDLD